VVRTSLMNGFKLQKRNTMKNAKRYRISILLYNGEIDFVGIFNECEAKAYAERNEGRGVMMEEVK
jgi:hypothetical protein